MSPCSFTPSGIFQLTPSRRATEQRLFFFCSFEISTHALTEGDNSAQLIFCGCCPFQLTPSRRATQLTTSYTAAMLISTHALTEGDEPDSANGRREKISTHALTEGDDYRKKTIPDSEISTHALTEGDGDRQGLSEVHGDFNSRPHGGRPASFRGGIRI